MYAGQPSTIRNALSTRSASYPGRLPAAALKRKGKGEDVTEDDMESVVHAHNSMNEITWQRVQMWEMLHRQECPSPSLLRFRGRPDDLRCAGAWGGRSPAPLRGCAWGCRRPCPARGRP
jgi:hypothetical protein